MGCFRTYVSAIIAAGAVSQQTDKGFELRVKNSEGPVERVCFNASGIPAAIRGSYFLAGPAKFDGAPAGDWKFKAMFDGLGMVNKFELHPEDALGKLCYTSAWMNTGLYKAFAADSSKPPRGVLFEDTDPPRSSCMLGMCDYNAPNDNNWVNMQMIGDQAVWFSDTPTMVVMDTQTLNCTGLKTWADDKSALGKEQPNWVFGEHMASGGSAHPLPKPGTESTMVEVLIEKPLVMGSYFVDLYTFETSTAGLQNRKLLTRIKAKNPQYFHTFGVTPNYYVLPFNLQEKNLGPPHKPIIIGNFDRSWSGIHVVDNKGVVVHVFDDVDPFYHTHIANTFENASGVTIDLVAFEDIPFDRLSVMDIKDTLNKTARDIRDKSNPRGQVRRLHMDLQTNTTTITHLTDNNKDYDFVKSNPAMNGKPYCIYYAVEWWHDDNAYASTAVMKHDVCAGRKFFWSEPNVYVNEPFFIANGANRAEDDGTIVFTANDGNKGKAIFVALDAKTFKEVERVQLPNHIPFTAHGQFVPLAGQTIVV